MVRATFDGDTHPIDVGFAEFHRPDGSREERAFVVMGGMGLDAAMIANTSGDLKKKVGWIAYVDGAARSLPSAKPFRVMYQLAEHRLHSARVQSVLFANCGSLPAGLELIPEASVSDGQLDIVIFQPEGSVRVAVRLAPRRVGQQRPAPLPRRPAGARAAHEGQRRALLARRRASRSRRRPRSRCSSTATSSARPCACSTRVEAGGLLVAVPKGHPVARL